MSLEEVEEVVDETLDNLPPEFSAELDNVAVVVEIWPSEEEFESIKAHPSNTLLFGLYKGIPRPKRTSSYSSLPDKITIYAGPILATSNTLEEAKQKIRDTILHEIGHHFGMSDEQLRKNGY